MRKYKQVFCIIIYILLPVLSWGQFSADIHDEIYTDIEHWIGKGYIKQIPNFRPLPEIVLKEILQLVSQKGNLRNSRKANNYLRNMNKVNISSDIYGLFRYNHQLNTIATEQYYAKLGTEAVAFSFLTPLVSFSAGFGLQLIGTHNAEKEYRISADPLISPFLSKLEEINDDFSFATIGNMAIDGALNARTSFVFGTSNLFIHAGVMRRSIGPFLDDGILVSSRGTQSPNLFVYWRGKKIAATWALFSLSSSQEFKTFTYDATNPSNNNVSTSASSKLNKFFLYNSLTWFITPNIEVSIFESVMFGKFNLGYLLPIKILYAMDSLSDFVSGNLIAGFNGNIRIHENIHIPFSLAIDDINARQLFAFNFNTKIKIAAETGIFWYPNNRFLKNMGIDYQIVTPYTYTHPPVETYESYSTAYNTENHTHAGRALGTTMPPSSHRITLSATITPLNILGLTILARFQQHNNPSAGILAGPLNDGRLLDDGYYSVYDKDHPTTNGSAASFQNRLDFLTGTIEHTIEFGVSMNILDIPLTRNILIYGNAKYGLIYTINDNLEVGKTTSRNNLTMLLGIKIKIY